MRKLKTLLPLTFIITVVLNLAAIYVTATGSTTVTLDPLRTKCVPPGGTFDVDIVVIDVIDLYNFDLKLWYDTSLLTATSITLTGNIFEDGSGMPDYTVWACQINDEIGRVWIALAQELGARVGVSGSGLFATITFTVDDDRGWCDLDLRDTDLYDSLANPIPHTAVDGGFTNVTVSVDPRIVWDPNLGAGATFDVDIVVLDVTDLYSFDFKLWYDTSVLTATSITLTGNIFEDGSGMPDYTVWACQINDEIGRVWIALAQELGARVGVSGSGLFATITFTVDAIGASDLDLRDTDLYDSQAAPIPLCYVQDGYFSNTGPTLWTKIKTKNPYPDWHLGSTVDNQTLHAPVRNTGDIGALVKVQFIVRKIGMEPLPPMWSVETWIGPGATVTLSTDPFTFDLPGNYRFSVVLWFRIHEHLTSEPYYLYEDQLGGAGIAKEGVNRINVKA